MSNRIRYFYDFGEFRLDADKHRLLRNGEILSLSPKALDTLLVLVQNPGKLLEREELMKAVWANTFVEDGNLSVAISHLRKALGQDGEHEEYIQTIPRVGYRFVAEVIRVEDQPSPLIVEKRTVSRTFVEEEIIPDTSAIETPTKAVPPRSSEALLGDTSKTSQSGLLGFSRRQTAAIASLIVVGLIPTFIYWRFASRRVAPTTGNQVKSMAVLPFKTLHSNSENDYLGLGLADALITQLGRMREVTIRPLSAVKKYDAIEHDPLATGKALVVDAVLEGTVQRDGENIRVTMRLLRVEDGVVLWSGKFDEKFTDTFALQDSISQQVAQASVLNLSKEKRELLAKRYTASVDAYHLYLKGRYFWNKRTAMGLQRSLDYFKQAIESDPTFALAYAGLADAYALGVWQDSLPQKVYIPRARAAAIKALEIDETVGEAHASLGFVRFWYEWDFTGAESAFRRAIELSPNHASAHHWYGEFLALIGRTDEGFKELRLAQEADPLSVIINSDIGKMLLFTGQTDQAIEQLKRTLELDSGFPVANLFLALAYHRKGLSNEAIAALKEEDKIDNSRSVFKFVRAYIYGQLGRKAEAASILEELEKPRGERFTPAYGIALIHVGLGQKDEAFAWLEKSRIEREPMLAYLKMDCNFDSIRDDPRFSELLGRVGF